MLNAEPKITAEYIYTDRSGEEFRKKCRYEPGFARNGKCPPKSFAWRMPDGRGGWRWPRRTDANGKRKGEPGCDPSFEPENANPQLLFNLPLVVECEVLHIHEGEKAAVRLQAILSPGHAATCPPSPPAPTASAP